MLISLSVIFAGCCVDELTHVGGDVSCDEYIRLSIVGTDNFNTSDTRATWNDTRGHGSIRFKWENVNAESDELNNFRLIITDGMKALESYSTNSPEADELTGEPVTYTEFTVTPDERVSNLAHFQTLRYYSRGDIQNAAYCFAFIGDGSMIEDNVNQRHLCQFEIPGIFSQNINQDPGFLKQYMHLYASVPYKGDEATMYFKHIPSIFRFIINNASGSATTLQSVTISMSDAATSEYVPVAASTANIAFDWTDGGTEVSFGSSNHESIKVNLDGNDTALRTGDKYIAYAMALPLSEDIFKGKILTFTLKTNNSEDQSFSVDAETFAHKNDGVYNWVGGMSYTVRFNVGSNDKVTGEILADKSIEIVSEIPGLYTLLYEGADGLPLKNYAEICTLDVNELAYYTDFIDVNIAPREAEGVGVYDADIKRYGGVSITGFKPDYKEPLYSVGILSDVHVVPENTLNCIDNFQNALTFLNDNNVRFTCICGDISEDGTAEEYAVYKEVVTTYSPSCPVYTTTGNHDCQSRGINLDEWIEYTGQDLLFEVTETLPNGNIDHYLFLGMTYWGTTNAYLSSSITWLEEKLTKYADDRCFIITHMFFPDRAGNMNEVYPPANWLSGTQLERLEKLCDDHTNSIWFSGHSHWKWSLQKYDKDANIYRSYNGIQPTSGWCVHVPSCSKPQDSNGLPRGESGSRVQKSKESEGAIMHVYEDYVDIIGVDLKSSKYLPIATYRLTQQ